MEAGLFFLVIVILTSVCAVSAAVAIISFRSRSHGRNDHNEYELNELRHDLTAQVEAISRKFESTMKHMVVVLQEVDKRLTALANQVEEIQLDHDREISATQSLQGHSRETDKKISLLESRAEEMAHGYESLRTVVLELRCGLDDNRLDPLISRIAGLESGNETVLDNFRALDGRISSLEKLIEEISLRNFAGDEQSEHPSDKRPTSDLSDEIGATLQRSQSLPRANRLLNRPPRRTQETEAISEARARRPVHAHFFLERVAGEWNLFVDFKTPVAAYEQKEKPCRVYVKWCGGFHVTEIGHSPLDVVAWHGNYAPCKYDLRTFSPVGAILFDHPDPSIFTVLTAPTGEEGTANVDFVIFPERWQVAEHSFRPPWYHKNIMSEFMGLIYGKYDAKEEGFVPGGMSLHNCMLPHGPDKDAFDKASNADLKPVKLTNTLAFMFETRFPQQLTEYAATLPSLQDDYSDCWQGIEKNFSSPAAEPS